MTCDTVTLPVPVLFSVTFCVALLPTVTLPNAMLDGVAVNEALTPVPESDTIAGELLALLTTEMVPVILPVEAGENFA